MSYWRQVLLALPLIFVAVAILKSDPTQLLAILSPPAGMLLIGKRLWQFIDFAWPLILIAAITFAGTSIVLRKLWPYTKTWHSILAFTASISMFLASAEARNYLLQQQEIKKLAFDCLSYRPFIASITKTGNEFQFEYHSAGRIGKDVYGWSYKKGEFYKVPLSVNGNLQLPC